MFQHRLVARSASATRSGTSDARTLTRRARPPDPRPQEEIPLVTVVCAAPELDVVNGEGASRGLGKDVVEFEEPRRVASPPASPAAEADTPRNVRSRAAP